MLNIVQAVLTWGITAEEGQSGRAVVIITMGGGGGTGINKVRSSRERYLSSNHQAYWGKVAPHLVRCTVIPARPPVLIHLHTWATSRWSCCILQDILHCFYSYHKNLMFLQIVFILSMRIRNFLQTALFLAWELRISFKLFLFSIWELLISFKLFLS